MLVDYHTHTSLCKHAQGNVEEYVLKAIELGLDEIGCSEHIPMPDRFDEQHRMSLEEYYSIYAPAVSAAREKYEDRIRVKRGIEADFFPGTEKWVHGFIEENDFDYVIGSVHFLGKWGFDPASGTVFVHKYDGRDINEVYVAYFDAVRRSAASGLFDIIAHFDLVKKFGHRPTADVTDSLVEALKAIKANDLCIEINTSGLRKPVKEIYPSLEILRMMKELKIPLTLGSDAHDPQDVGYAFEDAIAMIEEFGGGRISIFDKRQRSEVRVTSLKHAAA